MSESLSIQWRNANGEVRSFDEFMADCKKEYVNALLAHTGENIAKTARLAKRNRTALYSVLREVGYHHPRRVGAWHRELPGRSD